MKIKNIAMILVFALILGGFAAAHIVLADSDVSYTERRKLEQKPEISAESIFDGTFMKDSEKYLLDQFPMRDKFRTIKAAVRFDIFHQKDNNGVYIIGDSVFKYEYPLKTNQVKYAAEKISSVSDTYLDDANIYYSIIPDKNYFVAKDNGYPSLDYETLLSTVSQYIGDDITYIDIFPYLTIDDYYRTDTHWRQECITDAAQAILHGMGNHTIINETDFTKNSLSPFYGVYYGQSALNIAPDTLTYLTNENTDNIKVWSLESGDCSIYAPEKFGGMDSYDVYLYGAQSVMTIENEKADSDRELVIFRDSFGSSITPLLTDAYKKITLIDLRYISSSLIGEYIPQGEFDALFLYSTSLYNTGMLLK